MISSHTRSGIVHTAAHATGHAPGDSAANSVTPRRRTTPDAGRCRPPQSPAGVATDTYIDRMSPTSDFPEAVPYRELSREGLVWLLWLCTHRCVECVDEHRESIKRRDGEGDVGVVP